jgi:hypothetical protein
LIWLRISAADFAISRLRVSHSELRLKPSSLTLGAALVSVLNLSQQSIVQSHAWESTLLETASVHWGGEEQDAEDLELAFEQDKQVSLTIPRGMFFIADIEQFILPEDFNEPATAVLFIPGNSHKLSYHQLAEIYGVESWAHLRNSFGRPSLNTIPITPTSTIPRPSNMTEVYIDLWTARAPELIPFPALENDRLKRTLAFIDLNAPDEDNIQVRENPMDKLLNGHSLSVVLNHILLQFVHDIIERCPRRRDGSLLCNLSKAERSNVPIGILQDNSVPFIAAHLVVVKQTKWAEIIRTCFPSQDFLPRPNMHHFQHCNFFVAWNDILMRLNQQKAAQVVSAIHQYLQNVDWLPHTTETTLWTTSHHLPSYITIPPGWTDRTMKIAVNPNRYHRGNLEMWKLKSSHQCIACT